MEHILLDEIEIKPPSPESPRHLSENDNEVPETTAGGESDVYQALQFEDSNGESMPSDLSWDDDEEDVERGHDGNGNICPVCGKVLAAASSLKYHMKIHTGERPFPCQLCTRSFKVRSELNQHLKLDHGGQKPVKCNYCEMRFKRTDEMKRHQRIHTGEKPYKCAFCDKAFAHRSPWRQHEETHSHEKRYQCEDCGVRFEFSTAHAEHIREGTCKNDSFICCGEVFTKRMDYVAHKKEKHNETKKSVSCSECGKVFAFPYALKMHKQLHAGKKDEEQLKVLPSTCVTCKQTFNSRSTLYFHRRSDHSDDPPYQCKYCHRLLATVNALKSHERHHVSDAYVCTICDESFVSRTKYFAHRRGHKSADVHSCHYCGKILANAVALCSHERTHTGEKPYVCDMCGKGFIQKQALTAHVRSHTKERPFNCSYCGQTFTYYSAMKCHERIHTGEKPYECQYCKQRFTRFGTYQNHVRLHTGEKPHSCDICGKKFTQRSTQLSHMKTHEKKYTYDADLGNTESQSVARRSRTQRKQTVQTEEAAVTTAETATDSGETTFFVAQQQPLPQNQQVMFTENGEDGTVTKVVVTGNLENFDPSSLANVVFSGNVDAETIAKLILGRNQTDEGGVLFAGSMDENGYVITEEGASDGGAAQVFFTDNPQMAQTCMTLENGSYELVNTEQFSL